jgi:hypothetical protein
MIYPTKNEETMARYKFIAKIADDLLGQKKAVKEIPKMTKSTKLDSEKEIKTSRDKLPSNSSIKFIKEPKSTTKPIRIDRNNQRKYDSLYDRHRATSELISHPINILAKYEIIDDQWPPLNIRLLPIQNRTHLRDSKGKKGLKKPMETMITKK